MDGLATLWILGTELEFPAGAPAALNWVNSLELLFSFDSPIGHAAQELLAASVSRPSHFSLRSERYRFCVLLCRSNLHNWSNGLTLPLVGEEDSCKILSYEYDGSHLTVPAHGRLKEKFRVIRSSLGYVRPCLKLIFWTTQHNLKI